MIEFILFISTLLFLSCGQIGRLSFIHQQIQVYLYELPLFLFTVLFYVKQGGFNAVVKEKWMRIFIVFVGWTALTYFFSLSKFSLTENGIGLMYQIRLLIYGFWIWAVSTYSVKNQTILRRGFFIFVISVTISSFIQYFWYPDLRNQFYAGWDPHYFRMFGVFFDTYVAGAIFLLGFLVLISKRLIRKNFVRIILSILWLGMCVMTYSRIVYLILFFGGLIFLFKKRMYFIFAVAMICTVGFFVLLPKPSGEGVNLLRTTSVSERVLSLEKGVRVWLSSPVWGVGYNRVRYVQQRMFPEKSASLISDHAGAGFHSSFLIIGSTTGIVGLFLFLWFLYELGKKSLWRSLILLVLSILSFVDNTLLYPMILGILPVVLFLRPTPSDR